MKRSFHILAAALVLTFGLALAPANAINILTDGNARVEIDPASQAGVFTFRVDNVDQLFQEQYWVGVGTTAQQSVDAISAPTVSNLTQNHVQYDYSNATVGAVRLTYTLAGGQNGSRTADLAEQFLINNTSNTTRTYHIFQYSDFDLGAALGPQNVRIESPGDLDEAVQRSATWAVTWVGTEANRGEVNTFPNTRNSLNGGTYTLNNNLGPLNSTDATWALEWDVTLGPGATFILSGDKTVVPVPPTVLLLGSGLLGLLGFRLRKNRA